MSPRSYKYILSVRNLGVKFVGPDQAYFKPRL